MTIRRTKRRHAKKSNSKKFKRRRNNSRQLGAGDDLPFVIPSNDIIRLIRLILPLILKHKFYFSYSQLMRNLSLNKNAIYILLDNPNCVSHDFLALNDNIELYLEKRGINLNKIYAETDEKEIAILNEFDINLLQTNSHIYRLTKCFPFLLEYSLYENPMCMRFYTFPDALVKFDNKIFKHKETADYLINRMGNENFEYKSFNRNMMHMLSLNYSLVAMKLLNNVINAKYNHNYNLVGMLNWNPFASEVFKNYPNMKVDWSIFSEYTNDIQFLKLHQNEINIDSLLFNHNREIFPLIEEMFNNSENDLNYLMQIANNPHAIDLLKKHQDRLPYFHDNICKNPRGFDLIVKLPLNTDSLKDLFKNEGVTNNFKVPLGKTIKNTVVLNNSLGFLSEHDLLNVKKAHEPKENDEVSVSIEDEYGKVYTVKVCHDIGITLTA